MVQIIGNDVSSALGKVGIRLCIGIRGKKCFRPRRKGGRICKECHKEYMRMLREGGNSNRERVVDGFDFNQDA